jgi:hypothetical protein
MKQSAIWQVGDKIDAVNAVSTAFKPTQFGGEMIVTAIAGPVITTKFDPDFIGSDDEGRFTFSHVRGDWYRYFNKQARDVFEGVRVQFKRR